MPACWRKPVEIFPTEKKNPALAGFFVEPTLACELLELCGSLACPSREDPAAQGGGGLLCLSTEVYSVIQTHQAISTLQQLFESSSSRGTSCWPR